MWKTWGKLRLMRRLVVFMLALAAPSACSSRSATTSAGGPEQLCKNTIEALALAFSRCGRDYQVAYDEQLQAIVGGDCANVGSIRDEEELETCRKSLSTVPCDDLGAGKLNSTCTLQLERSK